MISLIVLVVFCTLDPAFSNLSWQPNSLIIADDDSSVTSLHEVHFVDGDFTQHELREINHGYPFTAAIAYDPGTKTLFWSARNPTGNGPLLFHIYSTVNGSGVVNHLYSSPEFEPITGLEVDSRRQLLFFSGYNLHVMNTNGENHRVLANLFNKCSMSPSQLALDTERLNIYVACYHHFVRMSYGGHVTSDIDSGSYIWNVDIDGSTDTIIFNNENYLYSLKMNGGTPAIRIPYYFPQELSSVIFNGSYLFITFLEEWKDLRIYDVITGRRVATVTDIPGDAYNKFSMVYIPSE